MITPRRLAVAWGLATAVLVGASLVELSLRMSAGLLIPLASDFVQAAASVLPWEAAWAAVGALVVLGLGRLREAWRGVGVGALACATVADAAARQVLGEAWLGGVIEADLLPTIGPGLLYFVLLPTVVTLLVLAVAAVLPRRAVATAAALLLVACVQPAGAQAPASGPNLLLVTIDTWRYDHLSAHPEAAVSGLTPRMDALARRGTLYTQARAHVPITVPSHASMLSGRTPWEHGVVTNGGTVGEDLPWLPEELQEAGWATGAVVSGAVIRGRRGFSRGFDRFHDDLRDPPRRDDLVAVRLGRLVRGRDEDRVFRAESDRALRRSAAFLDRVESGRPWFLWVHLYDVHLPHTVSEEETSPLLDDALTGLPDPCAYVDHPAPMGGAGLAPALGAQGAEERRRRCAHVDRLRPRVASYQAEVATADAAVGALLDDLQRRGALDQTAIVVTADHGESLTEHGSRMAHQFSSYESVLRVPLLVVEPGGGEGRRSDALVQHRDLPATVAELLGLPDSTGGRSWLGGGGLPAVASVTHAPFLHMMRAMGGDRPAEGPRPAGAPVRVAVRSVDLSLVTSPGLPSEVYDLSVDPHQVTDLVTARAEPVPEELARIARAILEQLGRRDPARLEEDDPDLEALRALGYVE